VHDQVLSVQRGARAVLRFALVLLGLKSMLGSVAVGSTANSSASSSTASS
jgi:hypothetical protein